MSRLQNPRLPGIQNSAAGIQHETRTYFCSKGLAARQIENVLREERDAIALWNFAISRSYSSLEQVSNHLTFHHP
ncbi:MAG: hypothetical protein WCH61_08925 [bacterium]